MNDNMYPLGNDLLADVSLLTTILTVVTHDAGGRLEIDGRKYAGKSLAMYLIHEGPKITVIVDEVKETIYRGQYATALGLPYPWFIDERLKAAVNMFIRNLMEPEKISAEEVKLIQEFLKYFFEAPIITKQPTENAEEYMNTLHAIQALTDQIDKPGDIEHILKMSAGIGLDPLEGYQ